MIGVASGRHPREQEILMDVLYGLVVQLAATFVLVRVVASMLAPTLPDRSDDHTA